MKVEINAETLLHLGELAAQNGTVEKWAELAMEWLNHFNKHEKTDMTRWKSQALEYCVEVYEQYTRAEVGNFHGSIIRCWKVGKRASTNIREEE